MAQPGYRLVLSEKPDAARRIAAALGGVSGIQCEGVEVYEVRRGFDGAHYIVCSAAGHLYCLADPQKNRGAFPVFDIEWFPLSALNRPFKFSRPNAASSSKRTNPALISKRIKAIRALSLNASELIHACDYDIEGETIGSNILSFACAKDSSKRILRAKFSSLTEFEIRRAFSSLEDLKDRLTLAGRTRHFIDFIWGVNVSRAITESVNLDSKRNDYRMLTIGRVQGPTLCFVVDREIETMSHVPIPYWALSCILLKSDTEFTTYHEIERIQRRSEAEKIFDAVSKAEYAEVRSISKNVERRSPPYPFNLGDLQKEAYRIYKLSPSIVLSTAEKLYLAAMISYPRTDSQRLPPSIGYSKIMEGLASNPSIRPLVDELMSTMKGNFQPRQGPKHDPAHPAIYPTGERFSRANGIEKLLYDLIVRRFLAAFGADLESEVLSATFDISGHKFWTRGEKTLYAGWQMIYPFFGKRDITPSLPHLTESELLQVVRVDLSEKFVDKPPRFTESSLLSKMESEGVGTKTTRAETISTLFARGYIEKEANLIPTEVGMNLVEAMEEYCPEIVSTRMTKQVERDIDGIMDGMESDAQVLASAMQSLVSVLTKLRSNSRTVGGSLQSNLNRWKMAEGRSTRRPKNVSIGSCPACADGKLVIIRSVRTGKRFLGCSNYSKGCKTSAPLPQKGIVRPANNSCKECKWPRVQVVYRIGTTSPWLLCPNMSCPARVKDKQDQEGKTSSNITHSNYRPNRS